jgi:membrane-bound metal-dependent hydrolase YbcI (DUF457 family)
MPFAVTHVLIPMILVDLFRDYVLKNPRRLPNKFVFLAGLAGIMPDADLISGFLFNTLLQQNVPPHRIFLHNIWLPLSFFAFFLLAYRLKKKTMSKVFLMLFIGWSLHLILDASLIGTIAPFFPLSDAMWGLNLIPSDYWMDVAVVMDAILLLAWLTHEEIKHKISAYF